MSHSEECDYNPYDNLDYYNIHHDQDEVREALVDHIQERKEDEHKKMILETEDL